MVCCISFSIVLRYFPIYLLISSLFYLSFRVMLISTYLSIFPFSSYCLLISTFIILWSEKILCFISVCWHYLSLILWVNTKSIQENGPCSLEKNVYSVAMEWMLCMCLTSFVIIAQVQCFLTDILSGWPIHWWKRGIEIPNHYCIVVSSFF